MQALSSTASLVLLFFVFILKLVIFAVLPHVMLRKAPFYLFFYLIPQCLLNIL